MSTLLLSHKQKACQRWLDLFYPIPNPLATWEQWQKYLHEDLKNLTQSEVLRERARLKYRLLFDDDPDKWLFKRLEMLDRVPR